MSDQGNWPLVIPKGGYYELEFWFEDDGIVRNLSGSTVRIQVRKEKSQKCPHILCEFAVTIDNSVEGYPEADGNVVLGILEKADTIDIDEDYGYFDVLVIDTGGKPDYPFGGKVQFTPTVTEVPTP
jgi:hypothetical protein